MPHYQILVLSSSVVVIVTGYIMLFVASQYLMSYPRLQTNVLVKFVDTACILLFYTHSCLPLVVQS